MEAQLNELRDEVQRLEQNYGNVKARHGTSNSHYGDSGAMIRFADGLPPEPAWSYAPDLLLNRFGDVIPKRV